MAGERPADPLRVGDTLNTGSSTGWTDEKHMLYISSLELSFVTQLYDGKVNSNGVFCWTPSVWRHETSYNGNHRNTQVDQVLAIPFLNKNGYFVVEYETVLLYQIKQQRYWEAVEADGAESRASQAEHTGSPSCYGDQEDRKAYYMDDNASTSESRQERISYHARRENFEGSSTSHFYRHGHSLSITELSDQNFIEDETEVGEEQSRECSKKRLKHAADARSNPAAPSGNANLQQEVFHHVEADYSGSSSDFDIGSLNAEPTSCKSQGPRWSV